ncbi:MAG: hypothetical protein ACI4B3_02340 [Prevotella sp.]
MKKILISSIALLGVLTACDPSKDDISTPGFDVTAEEFSNGFTFKQYSDAECTTEAADGNYFKFSTNPVKFVTVLTINDEGEENILINKAAAGVFKLAPKRGGSPSQKFYVRTYGWDGNYLETSRDVTVYVPTELSEDMRLLASDAYGYKVWTWDTELRGGAVWGNLGYSPGEDWTGGIWWGATPEELTGQLQHSDTGVATGEENAGAYMEFYDDGNIKTYDAAGNQIRTGKFSVEGFTGERNIASIDGVVSNWSYGTLKTSAGAILFPFQINGGGTKPTEFEIVKIDASHLQLIYAAPGTGSWSEATWWAFKSVSDPEAALTNFSTKDWTWDVDWRGDGGAWGNMGYAPDAGDTFVNNGNGIWWACPPADLTGQLQHSDTGVATGEEDPNAYMTFDWKNGIVTSYTADGTKIRGGKFEITNWQMGKRAQASVDGSQASWAYGTLNTDAGSILWPFKINGGGEKPTAFEIIQCDNDHLKLIYAAPGTGSWSEATWWAFKKK